VLKQSKPEEAARLLKLARSDAVERYALMEQLAKLTCSHNKNSEQEKLSEHT